MVDDALAAESVSTRTRILETCLRLFNESGPAVVTTAEISRVVGINEGNLYYYFKKKEDILTALFEQYETALNEIACAQPLTSGNDDFGIEYLKRWFRLIWEWRFFYRDGAAIKRISPKLRARNTELADKGQHEIRQALHGMVERGLLHAAPDEIDRLVVNAWIVSSYWIDYLDTRHNIGNVTREHLDWGFSQVLSLFLPYAVKRDAKTAAAPQK
jgi:AcrR family transcriptional regulator